MALHHQTLFEFQGSSGVPFGQQIVLIDNPAIFNRFVPAFFPYAKISLRKFLAECWTRKIIYGPTRYSVGRGLKSQSLFAGFFDTSFDKLSRLTRTFQYVEKQKEKEFELVIGKGDYHFDAEVLEKLPINLTRVYLNSLDLEDERLKYLPMGRDFRSVSESRNRPPCGDKKLLCYCNFSVNTHPLRKRVVDLVAKKKFVTKRHLGNFLSYEMGRDEFFNDLQSAKFCICPRGNAIDTFRMWDALYLGTVPIVVREARFHETLTDLPILFLNSYEEFGDLDEQVLEQTYSEMLTTKYNFEKLKISSWLGC